MLDVYDMPQLAVWGGQLYEALLDHLGNRGEVTDMFYMVLKGYLRTSVTYIDDFILFVSLYLTLNPLIFVIYLFIKLGVSGSFCYVSM